MVHSCIQMFVDDTKLYTEIQDDSDVTLLQSDLDRLQEWAKAWQLNLNPDKCKVLHLGRTNKHASCHMTTRTGENVELQSTELEKDLGLWINPSLNTANLDIRSHPEILYLLRQS